MGSSSSSAADPEYQKRKITDMNKKQPKTGDLIEIFRSTYQHWAVYIGGGYVVHLVVKGEFNTRCELVRPNLGVVKKEKLEEVVGNDRWKINNYLDKKNKPQKVYAILKQAVGFIGDRLHYNLATYNCKHFATELRYGKPVSQQNKKQPKPGDLIEIFRSTYQHWAVYIGGGYVVHLVVKGELVRPNLGVVKKEKLEEVVGNDRWKINNYLDKKYKPHQAHAIVKQATGFIDTQLPYSLLTCNCEHFANDLRYGKAICRQVNKVVGAIVRIVVGVIRR
ncbi:uncharacterized protein LOC105922526 [Fundulus heteroclitus]|uniref:uncharacterized protein LOC105922526 n=1 Tax=Fundulus heteroclitus TaxID=8078 RepID=UPI00165A72C8|nr:uncharacterized protein LOC105922526 [Fundulus heteroclitus]